MKTCPLLIEILTQELPAIPFLKEFPNIKGKFENACEQFDIEPKLENLEIFYTPRRIVIYAQKFPTSSKELELEFFGAPLSVAIENFSELSESSLASGDFSDAKLGKAAQSFLSKNNLSIDEISVGQKDGKSVLYAKKIIAPKPTKELLQGVFTEFINSLNFGKSMRWGDLQESFIRPVESICAFLGDEILNLSAFGVQSSNFTSVHRDKSFEPIEMEESFEPIKVSVIEKYFETLSANSVILKQDERKARILEQIAQIEKTHGVKVEQDCELLAEVVAITEFPTALFGEFDERFLALPKEVIITSMKENQRYFAVYGADSENLKNGFVVVSNSTALDQSLILQGNQKVLRARLEDALFFYSNDLKNWQSLVDSEKLENIVFVEGLGSMADKVKRERKIANFLYEKYGREVSKFEVQNGVIFYELLGRVYKVLRADLLSEMVYEFPELQGVMGGYYVRALGADSENIALAVSEQYLPSGELTGLPSNLLSAIVAMSAKLDSILALFSVGKIPTGSKDPYALRRAANGILNIVLDSKLEFNLKEDLQILCDLFDYKIDLQQLQNFFLERLENIVDVNKSIFGAVLGGLDSENRVQRDICRICENANALNAMISTDSESKAKMLSTFKRVANICKDFENLDSQNLKIDVALFGEFEQNLYYELQKIKSKDSSNAREFANALFGINQTLAEFFDNVLVNDSNEKLRNNRKNLVFAVYREFMKLGDIAKISI